VAPSAPSAITESGSSPIQWRSADLNGDGELDIAVANQDVAVLLNRGDGRFASKREYRTDDEAVSVAIGDLNGDRRLDIVTANVVGNSVSVLLNRGGGRFRARRDHLTGSASYSVAIGDLNGDRKPDLVASNSTGSDDETCDSGDGTSVSVLMNKGKGRFAAWRDFETGCDPLSVAVGDVNGDRKRDLVTANNGENTASVLLNITRAP
jgi:hypothetical protein